MTTYVCLKCGEIYQSTVDYQKLYCIVCNTEILHPRLQLAQKELDNMYEFINRRGENANAKTKLN